MRKTIFSLAIIAVCAACQAETWDNAYTSGLQAARAGQWAQARSAFQLANKMKRGDSATGVTLGGSIFERQQWRDGAPYSPKFLAAYSGLKCALLLNGESKVQMLDEAARELEQILDSRQYSKEAFFFLDECYLIRSQTEKRIALGQRYAEFGAKTNFKVDAVAVAPEDEALVQQMQVPEPYHATKNRGPAPDRWSQAKENGKTVKPVPAPKEGYRTVSTEVDGQKPVSLSAAKDPKTNGGPDGKNVHRGRDRHHREPKAQAPTLLPASKPSVGAEKMASPVQAQPIPLAHSTALVQNPTTPEARPNANPVEPRVVGPRTSTVQEPMIVTPGAQLLGAVPPVPDKYALIIGNSESKIDGAAIPFAADDAQFLRKSLITNAGYLDQNVELVINATSAQLAASINALASRIPDKATVLIYFTGVGENVDGRDYLAGVDTDLDSDTSTMISKDDVYKAFMARGARIFAFYQANRPIRNGHFFGSQIPLVGGISQMQATLPGAQVYGVTSEGKQIGLFTKGVTSVLAEIRSSRTPILDFGWQVFYKLRRDDTGTAGGSSNQSPSLPVLTNLASDARF